jgi:hypothetical protein
MGNKTDRIAWGEEVEMKRLFILFSFVFIVLIDWTYLFAKRIEFERETVATRYAKAHCGEVKSNFSKGVTLFD